MNIFQYDAVVIGTGAAGYNAACRLKELGVNVAIVTEGIHCGTSRNTGSDKQTYYKLGLGGDTPDSVSKMAEDLFAGGCVDGDNALCEAALSARCFMHLCELGVQFPTNRYGEYIGYKTDHDPYARATSAGPLTSKHMTEALQQQAEQLRIDIYDSYYAVKILKKNSKVCGLLCINNGQLAVFCCPDIVMATGGPAGIYENTVYPLGHTGSTGLAIDAGAAMQNLEFWQYGLASIDPRWNVSGTYMQVLPRFVSIDEHGQEHDFLWDHFIDAYAGLSMVFLKGYQWPFDPQKVTNGSSIIDVLVHMECTQKGRNVYLDFTKNPLQIDYQRLSPEAFDYLNKAGATFGTPFERLQKMNAPAIELYKSKGVDLSCQYLPIALCAQHCNGGIAVDMWWQSSVRGLFAVGECAGTHGIARPGGSALNAGQVGSLRAAQYIAQYPNEATDRAYILQLAQAYTLHMTTDENAIVTARRNMSASASAIRNPEKISSLLQTTMIRLRSACDYRSRELLLTQAAVLTAMQHPVTDPGQIQQITFHDNRFIAATRAVRPIPEDDNFFENVWRSYRSNKNIY